MGGSGQGIKRETSDRDLSERRGIRCKEQSVLPIMNVDVISWKRRQEIEGLGIGDW